MKYSRLYDAEKLPGLVLMFFLGMLALASLYWHMERMLFIDPAFVLFEIINSKSFIISECRYVAITTQIFPLACVILDFPLKFLLLIYSVSFNLFYLLAGYWIIIKWKELGLGFLLMAYLMLHVSDGFFWPNNEVHQGVCWGLVGLALYQFHYKKHSQFRWYHYLLLATIIFLATNAHLLSCLILVIGFSYIILEEWDNTNRKPNSRTLAFGFILVTGILFRWILSVDSWYDGEKLASVKSFTFAKAVAAFNNPQALWMYDQLLSSYLITAFLIFFGSYILIKYKKYLQLVYYLAALLIYFDLVCMTFPDIVTRSNKFYLESQWAGLGLVAALPVAITFLSRSTMPRLIAVVFFIIFSFRMVAIFNASPYFKDRLNNLTQLTKDIADISCTPALIYSNKDWRPYLIMEWGLPVETLILSTLQSDVCSVSIKIDKDNSDNFTTQVFHAPFKDMPLDTLNKRYWEYNHWREYEIIDDNILTGLRKLSTDKN